MFYRTEREAIHTAKATKIRFVYRVETEISKDALFVASKRSRSFPVDWNAKVVWRVS